MSLELSAKLIYREINVRLIEKFKNYFYGDKDYYEPSSDLSVMVNIIDDTIRIRFETYEDDVPFVDFLIDFSEGSKLIYAQKIIGSGMMARLEFDNVENEISSKQFNELLALLVNNDLSNNSNYQATIDLKKIVAEVKKNGVPSNIPSLISDMFGLELNDTGWRPSFQIPPLVRRKYDSIKR